MQLIKQISINLSIAVLLAASIVALLAMKPVNVYADQEACEDSGGSWAVIGTIPGSGQPEYSCTNCPDGFNGGASCTPESNNSLDPGLTLQPIDDSVPGTHDCNGVQVSVDVQCSASDNPILGYLGGIANFLAAGVGVVVVAVVAFSGVQYITSRGDPQKLTAAKSRLVNALIGLICFIFLYAFLQWLIPGGLFGNSALTPPDNTVPGPR
jgi:amino acid transporter